MTNSDAGSQLNAVEIEAKVERVIQYVTQGSAITASAKSLDEPQYGELGIVLSKLVFLKFLQSHSRISL